MAVSGDGTIIAASAPKAGRVIYIDAASGLITATSDLKDACGIAGEKAATLRCDIRLRRAAARARGSGHDFGNATCAISRSTITCGAGVSCICARRAARSARVSISAKAASPSMRPARCNSGWACKKRLAAGVAGKLPSVRRTARAARAQDCPGGHPRDCGNTMAVAALVDESAAELVDQSRRNAAACRQAR